MRQSVVHEERLLRSAAGLGRTDRPSRPGGGDAPIIAVACLAALLWVALSGRAQHAQESAASDEATLGAEIALLERQVDLARSASFLLLLDPSASELRLMFGGAVLQRYPVEAVSIGTPRIAFFDREAPADWRTRTWKGGALAPPKQIESRLTTPSDPSAPAEAPPALPPTAEEALPVPRRYSVRFEEGLALDVVQTPDAGASRWALALGAWQDRWADVTSALWGDDVLRVRVTATKEAAESLYRSLPDAITLLVTLGPQAP